ncbi:MAG: Nif3-like dinuclear metal center hexameric protein, partial [bacterium]|nr:Nif3-like dinuclear metal center hexameric protein [bacterium]
IVHHGLYWGQQQLITDYHYRRVRALIEADMALYAVHLPLDAHPEVGHNSQIAQQMGLVNPEPFAPYQGRPIGIKGRLASPAPCCQVAEQLEAIIGGNRGLLAFGPEQIRTVGIIAGSATEPELFRELQEQSIDLFVSGEPKHGAYYLAQEFGLNVFYGGHYQTETFGMRALGSHLAEHFRIKTEMIESPCFL